MNPLNKLMVLLLLAGFYFPSYASVDDVELITCSVYSDDEKEGEEEPDCE